jgi:hypothetical protein
MSKRKTDLEIEEGMTSTLNEYGHYMLSQKFAAERKAWREALGVPRGLSIPEKPLPDSAAERQAELDALTKEHLEIQQILLGPSRPPDGPELQTLVNRMWDLWGRCTKLGAALRDA